MKVMTIRVNTLKNREVRQRVMTIRPNTLSVSWHEGVYHKDSVAVFWIENYRKNMNKYTAGLFRLIKMITTVVENR